MLTLSVSCQSINISVDQRCDLLEVIINTDTLYSLPSLRWNSTDSITIFDQSGYFSPCIGQVKLKKKVGWKRRDFLPTPILGDWDRLPEARLKYSHYYIFERPTISGSLVTISFTRLLSNHKGLLTFKYENDRFYLVDKSIVQY